MFKAIFKYKFLHFARELTTLQKVFILFFFFFILFNYLIIAFLILSLLNTSTKIVFTATKLTIAYLFVEMILRVFFSKLESINIKQFICLVPKNKLANFIVFSFCFTKLNILSHLTLSFMTIYTAMNFETQNQTKIYLIFLILFFCVLLINLIVFICKLISINSIYLKLFFLAILFFLIFLTYNISLPFAEPYLTYKSLCIILSLTILLVGISLLIQIALIKRYLFFQ
jgi:hypothetical protein